MTKCKMLRRRTHSLVIAGSFGGDIHIVLAALLAMHNTGLGLRAT